MTARAATRSRRADLVVCPFTVVVDSREQRPYEFRDIISGAFRRPVPVEVPTMRSSITVGDYSVFGLPGVVVERKSKEDLYGSVVRRSNFIGRLERMSELGYAAVVVEAELFDCIENPPSFSKFHPRSLSRTLFAWRQRYRVDWYFVPGRDAGERTTFRILERFWIDHRPEASRPDGSTVDSGSLGAGANLHEDVTQGEIETVQP